MGNIDAATEMAAIEFGPNDISEADIDAKLEGFVEKTLNIWIK